MAKNANSAEGFSPVQDLISGYQRGEPAAARELIRQVSPVLVCFLSTPAFRRGCGEGLLRECWLRIHQARHTYRPGACVLPWIVAIARHTRADDDARDHLLRTVLQKSSRLG